MSLLDNEIEIEPTQVTISQPDPDAPPKKRRGRPPGSTNKPKTETAITPNLANAIRGLFAVTAIIASFFGYKQKEDLTDSEIMDGARAFTPIADKVPWLTTLAIWLGPPVWLYMMFTKKFERKDAIPNAPSNESPASPNPNPSVDNRPEDVREPTFTFIPRQTEGEALGEVSTR